MVGESGTSHMKGTVHRYYKCVGVKRHRGCDKKTVKKEWIENIVISEIKKIIENDSLLEQIADSALEALSAENNTLPLLRKQYAQVQKSIDNLLNAMEQGIITASTKERMEALEQQKSELSIQILRGRSGKADSDKERDLFWFPPVPQTGYKKARTPPTLDRQLYQCRIPV